MGSNSNRSGGIQFYDALQANNLEIFDNVTANSIVAITDTAPATNSTTGAFQCDGGISVDEASWFGGALILEGLLTTRATKRNTYQSAATESVDTNTYGRVEITAPGNTLSLINMVDGQGIEIANESGGSANLNFDLYFQGVLYSAPVTMPANDIYPLIYDASNTRFKF